MCLFSAASRYLLQGRIKGVARECAGHPWILVPPHSDEPSHKIVAQILYVYATEHALTKNISFNIYAKTEEKHPQTTQNDFTQ